MLQPQKFSDYFNLSQADGFDFLDIYASQDIEVFLDPYGISAMGTAWARECESQITSYFQYLIESIQRGDTKTTKQLLNALHEVDEVGIGYSSTIPKGRGIGIVQAQQILEAFENSEAAKSGDIKDIADCALLIPGINRDKISDVTANILKRQLVSFTQEQCRKYKIPVKKVPIKDAFDFTTFTFKSYYADLPVVNENPKILLPVSAVRRKPELSKDKYYRNFVLEFLKAEHEHAGDALATVLKNGRIIVRIADLKKKYPMGVNFLYEFSKEHPIILKKFKSELRRTAIQQTSPRLKVKRKILTSNERIDILSSIKYGTQEASDFHKISFDNLIHIFGKRLSNPQGEVKINEGRKRIDIVFNNTDKHGFFNDLNNLHHIKCPRIIIECKNYGPEIGNPELDQILGRLNPRRGKFGILICRSIKNKNLIIKRCKDAIHDQENYVIVLDDTDIKDLLLFKASNSEFLIDDYFSTKLDELIM